MKRIWLVVALLTIAMLLASCGSGGYTTLSAKVTSVQQITGDNGKPYLRIGVDKKSVKFDNGLSGIGTGGYLDIPETDIADQTTTIRSTVHVKCFYGPALVIVNFGCEPLAP